MNPPCAACRAQPRGDWGSLCQGCREVHGRGEDPYAAAAARRKAARCREARLSSISKKKTISRTCTRCKVRIHPRDQLCAGCEREIRARVTEVAHARPGAYYGLELNGDLEIEVKG